MRPAPSTARLVLTVVVAVLLASAAAPAAADTLVMTDGSTLETKGSWEVRGAMVVFTLPNGTLSSLRASEIDLEASKQATTKADMPPADVVEPIQTEPVVTLTDDDVTSVDPDDLPAWQRGDGDWTAPAELSDEAVSDDGSYQPPPETQIDGDGGEEDGAATSDGVERLVVAEWEQADRGEGTTITGVLQNTSMDTTTKITLQVTLVDNEGEILAQGRARLGETTLIPGRRTNFMVAFDDVLGFDEARFQIESTALVTRPSNDG